MLYLTGPPFKAMYPLAAAAAVVFCLAATAVSGLSEDAGGGMTPAQWKAIAKKKIYFGHMSVGDNMVAGIQEIVEAGGGRLQILKSGNAPGLRPATLVHSEIGHNKDAVAKINAFAKIIDGGLGKQVDIALFKFCYVDVNADTDLNYVFSCYLQKMGELERKYPKVKFAHVTVPLRSVQTGWKASVKKAIFLPVRGYADNIKRNEYNEMLRREYGGKGRLFDLAEIESTYTDGSRSKFMSRNTVYYSLAADKSDDGGHLNSAGRKVVAEKFLIFLAGLK